MSLSIRVSTVQLDRAAGVLLAAAAGAALGAGYGSSPPAEGTEVDLVGGGPAGYAPGEWTEDIAMGIAVAQVTATGADLRTPAALDAVATGLGDLFAGAPRGVGDRTRAVLAHGPATAAEMAARAVAVTGSAGDAGSLLRIAAVGLAYLGDPGACAAAAAQVSRLTHPEERAVQACQLWSHAIRHAVLTGTFGGVRDYLARHPDLVSFWGPLLDQAEAGEPADFQTTDPVVRAVQTAWWAITRADAVTCIHLQQAVELCVQAGGDPATTAAVAGGLLGARWGASAVPQRWRRTLHGRPGMTPRDLIALGVRTVRVGADDPDGWPTAPHVDYTRFDTGHVAVHPHDDGVLLGGAGAVDAGAVDAGGFDAEVALCRVGSADPGHERVEVWLVDADHANPNLKFVLEDAARTVQTLRGEGERVLLHGVQGESRTPTVAARYSQLLSQDPQQVLTAMPWAHPRTELWEAVTKKEPDMSWLDEMPDPNRVTVTIYDKNKVGVEAYIGRQGQLEIEGQDLAPPTGFGDEYEYYLTVEARSIPTIIAALGGKPGDDVLELMQAHGDVVVSGGVQRWLNSLGVKPDIHTWW